MLPEADWEVNYATIRNQEGVTSKGVYNSLNSGAGERNRTSNLRFTNQSPGVAQVVEDMGNPRSSRSNLHSGTYSYLFLFAPPSFSLPLLLHLSNTCPFWLEKSVLESGGIGGSIKLLKLKLDPRTSSLNKNVAPWMGRNKRINEITSMSPDSRGTTGQLKKNDIPQKGPASHPYPPHT